MASTQGIEQMEKGSSTSGSSIPSKGRVRFGSVQVHHHPLTLGVNPGGSTLTGPPLTLRWDSWGSDHYPTLDDFAAACPKPQKSRNTVFRILGSRRREIAAEEHSPAEIARVEAEIMQIREARFRSSMDPPEGSIKALLQLQVQESRTAAAQKKKGRGLFRRFLRVGR